LRSTPANFDAWLLLGMLSAAERRFGDALVAFSRAVELKPASLEALGNLGAAQLANGEPVLAAATFRRALARFPNVAPLHHNLALALHRSGDLAGADACYARAIAFEPRRAAAYRDRASVLEALGRLDEAFGLLERALALDPNDALAHYNMGVVLERLGRLEQAVAAFNHTVALRPDHVEALNNLGSVLNRLGDWTAALRCLDRAVALRPGFLDALNNRGDVLLHRNEPERALESFGGALALAPNDASALANSAAALARLKRHEEAVDVFARLVAVAPRYEYAQGALFFARMGCCDWSDYAPQIAVLRAALGRGERVCQPFPYLRVDDDAAEQRRCAELYVAAECPPATAPLSGGERYGHARVRIAYLSADLHDHATAYLIAELLELHDRERFEVTVVSFGPPSDGAMRRRLEAAVEHFVDWRETNDRTIAERLRAREIDIAIDLKGYTLGARPQILAQRPAPVQVGFLGYPGTTGAPYIDYLIADRHLIPPSQQAHYSEQVVYLPECYQPNDSRRPIAERVPSRAELGLPEGAFVFCAFHDSYKITPEAFECWLRLLERTPGSVLWLLESQPAVRRNLCAEAAERGIAPERLVFAPKLPLAEHLARQRRADLFLDTFPVNAHTTASDALWAGLPLVTRRGTSMVSRVAASLLTTMGLPELITESPAEYETRALELAHDPAALGALRSRLERNRETSPLFDAARFRRHFEAALLAMYARHASGLPPASLQIPAERSD
jgi:predicted O-linked N-acetylglucosamine transferase (SPINDLY family)